MHNGLGAWGQHPVKLFGSQRLLVERDCLVAVAHMDLRCNRTKAFRCTSHSCLSSHFASDKSFMPRSPRRPLYVGWAVTTLQPNSGNHVATSEKLGFLKPDLHALYVADRDPRVLWHAKAVAACVAAY